MHSDDELVQVEARRERFEVFFRREFNQVRALVIKAGFSREDAYDAAQEAMVRAYEKWDHLNKPARWVRTVAMRHVLDANRRRREEIRRGIQGGWVPMPQDDGERIAEVDHRMRLLPLLAALAPQQQLVIALDLDGWTTTEIAGLIDVTLATIRSHRRFARQSLQRAIGALDRPRG